MYIFIHNAICLCIQWLETDFIEYLNEWEKSASTRTDLDDSDKQKLCISRETIEGFRFTGKIA